MPRYVFFVEVTSRVMIDVSSQHLETTVFGVKVSSPILIAATAMQKMGNFQNSFALKRSSP